MTAVTTRPGEPSDAAAIAAVRVAGWRAGYAGIVEDAVLAAMDPVTEGARRQAEWGSRPVPRVAESRGVVLGFAITGPYRRGDDDPAWPAGPHDGELMALYVDPAAWSRGVGSALQTAP